MTNNAITRSLSEVLNIYVKKFNIPNSQPELLAIASSILTFQQKHGDLAIASEQVEALIQQVVEQFEPQKIVNSVADAAAETLAKQVHDWRGALEDRILNTLDAYVKEFLPEKSSERNPEKNLDLREIVLSVIPLVENAQIHRAAAESIIQQVRSRFSWQAALDQAIGTEASAIAQQLAKLLQYGNLEQLVKETVVAYHHGFDRTLETITESLVQSALSNILGNAVQFKVDTDIDLESQKFLIKQITLKLNLMQSPIHPSKTAREIAAQMQTEIDRFNAERRKNLAAIDLTKPAILGDLEVGIPKQP